LSITKRKIVFNRASLLLALTALGSGMAANGHAQVCFSLRGLLAEQFHRSELVDGYALFDREIGQHEYIDFAAFFDGEARVARVEVVAYREPYGEAIRSKRFRN